MNSYDISNTPHSFKYSLIKSTNFNEGCDESKYILDLEFSADCKTLAALTDTNYVQFLSSETFSEFYKFSTTKLTPKIISSNVNSNYFFLSTDEFIGIIDLRVKNSKFAQTFEKENDDLGDLNSFDVNNEEKLIIAGTNQHSRTNDVYLSLWDIRKSKVMQLFSEGHSESITSLAFHPKKSCLFASGSCDELINIYDTSLADEEDALLTTLKAGQSIDKICWVGNEENLLCLTQNDVLQFWNLNSVKFDHHISQTICGYNFDYIIDILLSNNLICLGNDKGDILLCIQNRLNEFEFSVYSSLTNGHNSIVRSICSTTSCDIICTGGEDGKLLIWQCLNENQSQITPKVKTKKHRMMPY